ncbi:MAG: ParA family protein [Clostridia bacterium]|nr:ParA family protein [Clostridia bacterium]
MIISVTNQKGGVGKTTTAINVSAGLALKGKRVLLLDLDPQGNATSGLGIEKNNKGIYDVMINGDGISDVIMDTNIEKLKIIPSNIDLSGATVEMVALKDREMLLKNALEGVKGDYDYVIIDCPPSLDLLTVNAFTASDKVLVPIQCEYYALEGLGQLMNTVKLIKKRLNPALDVDGVALTMYDSRTNLSQQVVDEVKKYFAKKVYRTHIPRNVRLAEAPSFGEPIQVFDRYCPGSLAYMALCDEIIERNEG